MRFTLEAIPWLLLLMSDGVRCQKPVIESLALQADITSDNLWANLVNFSDIAIANGGNRAFGLPGFAASVDFVWSRVSGLEGMKAWKQDFPVVFSRTPVVNLTAGGTIYEAWPVSSTPYTDTDGFTAELVLGPAGTAACNVSSYAGMDVTGKIVLLERTACPPLRAGFLDGVAVPAAQAGAVGVVVYNDIDLILRAGSFSRVNASDAPTVFINRVEGLELKSRLDTGETFNATMISYEILDTRITQNVFVETETGDPSQTVMLGAHLDSVTEGPGINDNASGCSLLLELSVALANYTTANRVRFAWWGAEEKGTLGSRYFVNNLTPTEADDILAYVNFDMVSRGYFGVFDGDGSSFGVKAPPGSETIEQLFMADMASKNLTVTPAPFTNGSDYAPFWQVLNKPVGGLSTGTGSAQDPCYHMDCDTISNPNIATLTVNAKTAANALSILAMDGLAIVS